jgi:hypothetical protein
MNILKLALLGSLRIAFFGFLKVALCAYTLFLPDTAVLKSGAALPELFRPECGIVVGTQSRRM